LDGSFVATGTVRGSSSLTPGSYLTGSAYNGGANQTFNVDATSANTANKVVARDASGNFSAGTITASMSTSLNPGSYLTGSAYNGGTARTFNVDATSANTAGKVVARDGSGNFSAGTITASMSTSLTPGSYLTGSAYNGGTARTFNVDATSTNTVNKVVARDASGNFSAGTITASMSTSLTPGSYLTGFDYNGGTARTFHVDATATNTAGKVVARDDSGNFSAGTITTTSVSGNGSGLTSLNASNLASGTVPSARLSLAASDIPNLSASKITSGILGTDRIPDLSANKITSDVLSTARIPDLDAGKITTGTLGTARIPDLDASKITSGTLTVTSVSATTLHYPAQTIQPVLNGGGTVTFDASGNIKWDNRVTAIPVENTEMGGSGHIDITCPTSGTITYFSGTSGSTNAVCTAAGIPMGTWEALYYVVTPGQSNASDQTRFRKVYYQNTTWDPDSNWILICARNGDGSQLKWLPGQTTLAPGQSYNSATRGTYGAVFADSATNATYANSAGSASTATTFTVTTANGERLRVDSSGNVGINTTNPQYRLDVNGVARLNNVAFAAYRDEIHTPNRAYTSTVVFNNEYFDQSGNYDTGTGLFTAPVAGIYHFSFNAYTNQAGGTLSRLYLYKNNAVYTQKGAKIDQHGNGIDVTIKLAVNDTVSLRGTSSYPVYLYAWGDYNIFCGHLLTAV